VYTGYIIPPYYDSMIAKLIVRTRTRAEALVKMRNALDEFIVEGVPTTIPFHKEIFNHPDFVAGNYDIGFLETRFRPIKKEPVEDESATEPEPKEEPTEKAAAATDKSENT
jgi:acetyl-CoA carboxylase biotin carboxylase subunit